MAPPDAAGGDRPSSASAASSELADLPDPPALASHAHFRYVVEYDRGVIRAGDAELACSERAVPSARRIGRYAFELWLGHELVDRVRFDFPLLAAETPPRGSRRELHEAPRFGPGARVTAVVSLAASGRATSARILDRATRQAVDVPWPPTAPAGVTLGASACPAAGSAAPPRTTGAIQPR